MINSSVEQTNRTPVVVGGAQTHLRVSSAGPTHIDVIAHAHDGVPRVVIETELLDAVGYWRPMPSGRPLPATWDPPSTVSLVNSTPAGALYRADGASLLGWAAVQPGAELQTSAGVSEEAGTFVVEIWPTSPVHELRVHVEWTHQPLGAAVRDLIEWTSARYDGTPRPIPDEGSRPVYSTWYSFNRQLSTDELVAEATLAARIGFGSVFIDDGWQLLADRGYAGCGDWIPDPGKFSNLRSTVAEIRDLGMTTGLWVAPLLLGEHSALFPELVRFAPAEAATLGCRVLDPRQQRVRDHVANTLVGLVRDFDVDVLKIDFLDQAAVYSGQPSDSDLHDVGSATALLLSQVRDALHREGLPQVAFEFRQPYVSPAMARFGEILRANDCPADSAANRRSVLDARLVSAGQLVHSDPMMWGPGAGPQAVAQQIHGAWFSVPQVSMRLTELPPGQLDALAGLLAFWRDLSLVTLGGDLSVAGAEFGYLRAGAQHARSDRSVLVDYCGSSVHVDQETSSELTLINATRRTSVVLELGRPIVEGLVKDASAQVVDVLPRIDTGLHSVAVPTFGSLTLFLTADAATSFRSRSGHRFATLHDLIQNNHPLGNTRHVQGGTL